MPKATSQLSAALRRIDDQWDEQRSARTLLGVHRKQRRRSWQRRGAAAVALMLVAFAAERAWVVGAHTPLATRTPAADGGGRPNTTRASADDARADSDGVEASASASAGLAETSAHARTRHASDAAARTSVPAQDAEPVALGASAIASQDAEPAALGARANAVAMPSRLHMELEDGSEVTLHDEHTQLTVTEVTHRRAVLDMRTGRARFDVVHRVERAFVVRCGEVTIEVLGTAFELERDGSRTHVSVLRGRVAVSWSTGRTELTAGEAAWFPRGEPGLPPAQRVRNAAKQTQRRAESAQSASSWRESAERGEFNRAYELLRQAPQPVAEDVEQLLLAADTARLSGHPEAALPYLRRVVAQHAADSRAPLAAFTLGGVLMQQLGQPRDAEAAYARARELASSSPLAEDALARQVEAAHRAGDAALARALGQEYLSKYPKGRRVHAVQRFAGL